MYNYTASLEAALLATDRASLFLSKVESAIYKADNYYQEVVIPYALHAGIMTIHYFIRASIFTYCTGVKIGHWYRNWAADYYAPLPVKETIVIEAQPLLSPAKITPLNPPTDTGERLLGEAIKTGLKLIEPSTEEVQELIPGELLLLPAVSPGAKPKRAPRKRKPL